MRPLSLWRWVYGSSGFPKVIGPDLLERIAEAIHERYRSRQAGRLSPGDPALAPWPALEETLKSSSRGQAAHIESKLHSIGCAVVPAAGAADFAFSPAELERLAELEHLRWVADRRANGWVHGERDPSRRITPYLVEYHELPEEIRELDRDAVRSIPALLRDLGLAIRRGA